MPHSCAYGREKTLETVDLAKMKLAINGLRDELQKANSCYEDARHSFGVFDDVLADPTVNVDEVSVSRVEKDKRFSSHVIAWVLPRMNNCTEQ
jgi:type I restriction enzyme M protein